MKYTLRLIYALAIVFGCVVPASTQAVIGPATFSPPNPTSADTIRATFTGIGCTDLFATTVSGATVTTNVTIIGCIYGPPTVWVPLTPIFGPLPPGNYTYEVYVSLLGDPPVLAFRQPLVVSAAPAVPAFERWVAVLLIAALTTVGAFRIASVPPN